MAGTKKSVDWLTANNIIIWYVDGGLSTNTISIRLHVHKRRVLEVLHSRGIGVHQPGFSTVPVALNVAKEQVHHFKSRKIAAAFILIRDTMTQAEVNVDMRVSEQASGIVFDFPSVRDLRTFLGLLGTVPQDNDVDSILSRIQSWKIEALASPSESEDGTTRWAVRQVLRIPPRDLPAVATQLDSLRAGNVQEARNIATS